MTFLGLLAKCLRTGPDGKLVNTLEDLWSLKPVLYRISSPFIKLDYIGRSANWFRRYCEHRRGILNSQDTLPCYKYIRDHHPSTWFSLPLMATPTVVAMEPQVIGDSNRD